MTPFHALPLARLLRSGTVLALVAASLSAADETLGASRPQHALDRPVCGLALGRAAIPDVAAWDDAFERRWGPIGAFDSAQIRTIVYGGLPAYDDSDARFAWIVHYWIRAFVVMADLTGDPRYMAAAASLIDATLHETDQRRIERGDVKENYSRDPGYFRNTGKGGPFWKRGTQADVLDTGQVANGIMRYVDLVLSQPERFAAYQANARRYLDEVVAAVDAFDNDWQNHGAAGTYHYRDSQGSGDLGVTPVAFNQAATMMTAQVLVDTYRPSEARKDKVRRLAAYWRDVYMDRQPDGTILWRYIDHRDMTEIEDAGHASIDLDFLVAAEAAGYTQLTRDEMEGLTRTYLTKVYDGDGGLNTFVDGRTQPNYDEHWNATLGWFELATVDPKVADSALTVFNTRYGPDTAAGVLWARPMLGWAKLLYAATPCRR